MQSANSTPDPVQELIGKCHQDGRDTALTTGDQTADQARIDLAKDSIAAHVEALWKGPLNPQSPEDTLLVEAVSLRKEQVRRLETTVEQARRRANAAQEAVPAPEPPPEAPSIVICVSILALALTFSMSLADLPLLSEIDDPVLRLLAALGMGLAIASVCITSMFNLNVYNPDASVVRPKATREIWGVLAGLIMVFAFGLVRLSTTGDDFVLTGGLVAIDLAVLLYAKASAAQYRNKQAVHADRNDARIQLIKIAAELKQQFEAAVKGLGEAQANLDESMGHLQLRLKLDFKVEVVTRAAITAWEAGYAEGMDSNRSPQGTQPSTQLSTISRRTAA